MPRTSRPRPRAAIAKANITIIGLGNGRARPTLTFTTANTATIAVSAANVTFRNFRFVANFLSIAAAITLTTATGFRCEQCAFHDTSGVLNFLNAIKSTGAANTIDGIHIEGCKWLSLGTTSVNTLLLSANDIDDAVLLNNRVTYQTTVDQAGLLVLTAGVPTNLLVQGNFIYRKNTTTANGSSSPLAAPWPTRPGSSSATTCRPSRPPPTSSPPPPPASRFFENRVSGVVNATGFVIPGADFLRGSIPRPWKGSRREGRGSRPGLSLLSARVSRGTLHPARPPLALLRHRQII